VSYPLTSRLKFVADGSFLQMLNASAPVSFRSAAFTETTSVSGVDHINGWKTGLQYTLTAANTVDLGWEEVQWSSLDSLSGSSERYYNIGFGHTFNSNSSLKLLYQIVDYKAGGLDPLGEGSFRGGITNAEFLTKF
jgi:hypothetical protein